MAKFILEELGKGFNSGMVVEVDYDYNPPERMTHDYPGSPGYFEITDAKVLEYCTDSHQLQRGDRPDWFVLLDKIALDICQSDPDISERLQNAIN